MGDYYNHSGYPATKQSGASASARSEFSAVQAAFAKLPSLTGNGSKWWRVNALGTAAEAVDNATLLSAIGAAPLASPTFTGVPAGPTAAAGTNTTQLATTAFVRTEVAAGVAALVDSSPTTLDTLNELAAALGDDPNFATTMAAMLGTKAPLASPTFTGTPSGPTAAPGTNTTQFATTEYVMAGLATIQALPSITGSDVGKSVVVGAGPGYGVGSSVLMGTAQSLTSGTQKSWTIPDWINEFTLSWHQMVLSGSAARIRIGTSGGEVTSGYKGGWTNVGSGGANYSTLSNSLFFNYNGEHSGSVTFRRVSGNVWSFNGHTSATGAPAQGGYGWSGTVDAGAPLTAVYLESTDGAATFTAGTANTQGS